MFQTQIVKILCIKKINEDIFFCVFCLGTHAHSMAGARL